MRLSVLTLAALVGISTTPAAAAPSYPWCARYSNTDGACSFGTFAQCMEDVSGIGGACVLNPGYSGTSGSYAFVPRGAHRPIRR